MEEANSDAEGLIKQAESEEDPRGVGGCTKGSEWGDTRSTITCVYGNAVVKLIAGTGEEAQWLRALNALSEDGSLDTSINFECL